MRENVDNGIILLNTVTPFWRARVQGTIVMESVYACILGKVFGSYKKGLVALGIDDGTTPVLCGFEAEEGTTDEYEALSGLWEEEVYG